MGGAGLYHPPVKNWTGIASWKTHTNRGTPSTEPGVDWYCPRFTPLYAAAAGRVVDVYDGIGPATGRFIAIDLADGRRVRYLHLESRLVSVGDWVEWGQHIGYTGATGYGERDWSWNVAETGGAHVHQTIFPGHAYVFGRYATLDPWPLTNTTKEDDMPDLNDIFNTPVMKNAAEQDVSLAQLLKGLDIMAQRIPANVWGEALAHPIAKDAEGKPAMIRAGDFLRYEPAEHANTRAAVAAIAGGAFDYEKFAAALAPKLAPLVGDAPSADEIAEAVKRTFATSLTD